EDHVLHLYEKYAEIEKNEVKVEEYNCEDADIILTAYGTTARIVKNVIQLAEKENIKIGLVRPITLWPFPSESYSRLADGKAKAFLSVEMSMGQMVDDVKIAVAGKKPVYFYGRTGGMVPEPKDILAEVKKILGK
ncbi:MAG: 3-methyl-2-oxobutanoate dehydrogenase subunit beta, partial [Clostridiales bacterium]|nr:3-methyl-2-oxobutanoate dehydrogenase subunit beta [Clostridiales bacterium]